MDRPQKAHDEPSRSHWIVKTNYRLRAASFAVVFIGLGLELHARGASPTLWALLAFQFLVYPHLMYWRACRAANSRSAELNNLLIDSLLIGSWVALLQFPLWPSFTMWLGCSLNITITNGRKGMASSMLAFLVGVLAVVMFYGFRFAPDTRWPTTALSIVGMAAYLIAIGITAHSRNQQLRAAREKLRLGEQALHVTNETLEQQLAEIRVLQDRLREQALRDPLTGLFNRRYLDTIVPHELARCARDRVPLCLVMMDLDHFKQINDTHGHQGGDEVLREMSALLHENVRVSDVACRYGGEEFLLLLPNMPVADAVLRADQWRTAFAATAVPFAGTAIHATVSIGIACFPGDGSTGQDLIRCADLALYRAKAEGRNRVVVYAAEMAPAA